MKAIHKAKLSDRQFREQARQVNEASLTIEYWGSFVVQLMQHFGFFRNGAPSVRVHVPQLRRGVKNPNRYRSILFGDDGSVDVWCPVPDDESDRERKAIERLILAGICIDAGSEKLTGLSDDVAKLFAGSVRKNDLALKADVAKVVDKAIGQLPKLVRMNERPEREGKDGSRKTEPAMNEVGFGDRINPTVAIGRFTIDQLIQLQDFLDSGRPLSIRIDESVAKRVDARRKQLAESNKGKTTVRRRKPKDRKTREEGGTSDIPPMNDPASEEMPA